MGDYNVVILVDVEVGDDVGGVGNDGYDACC